MKSFVLVIVLTCASLSACTATQVQTAEQAARDWAAKAIGLLTLAEQNPALVEEAKAAAVKAMQAADPKDAAAFASAVAHIDANNITAAKQVIVTVVGAK